LRRYHSLIMASERIQRRIDLLLDEADQALADGNWPVVSDCSQKVLALEPNNSGALTFLAAAERARVVPMPPGGQSQIPGAAPAATTAQPTSPSAEPRTSFDNGRYQVYLVAWQ